MTAKINEFNLCMYSPGFGLTEEVHIIYPFGFTKSLCRISFKGIYFNIFIGDNKRYSISGVDNIDS